MLFICAVIRIDIKRDHLIGIQNLKTGLYYECKFNKIIQFILIDY